MDPKVRSILDKVWNILNILGPFFTVVALGLAVYHLTLSVGQERRISDIAGSVSTKYVAVFPENIDAIKGLVSDTKKNLRVVVDVPAYGHFSKPEAHARYRQAMTDLLSLGPQQINLEMLTYTPATRRRLSVEQFGLRTEEQFQLYKKTSKTYRHYFDYWKERRSQPEPTSLTDFYNLLENENEEFESVLKHQGAKFWETDDLLPVFVWLSDDRQAIFSFYNYGTSPAIDVGAAPAVNGSREVSFQTFDQNFIPVLSEIMDTAFKKSKEVQP